jgi:hypothetical protein
LWEPSCTCLEREKVSCGVGEWSGALRLMLDLNGRRPRRSAELPRPPGRTYGSALVDTLCTNGPVRSSPRSGLVSEFCEDLCPAPPPTGIHTHSPAATRQTRPRTDSATMRPTGVSSPPPSSSPVTRGVSEVPNGPRGLGGGGAVVGDGSIATGGEGTGGEGTAAAVAQHSNLSTNAQSHTPTHMSSARCVTSTTPSAYATSKRWFVSARGHMTCDGHTR